MLFHERLPLVAAWGVLAALWAPAASQAAPATAAARPGPAASAAATGEPEVWQPVFEDRAARIEELRVRGQTRRIVVQPKTEGARPYEVVPADPGQPAQPSAGQRVWSVFRF